MLEKYSIHTDLALEEKERFESDHVEVQGVILEEEYDKEREIDVYKRQTEKRELPWWQKYTLTLNEASEYFGIGYKKLKLFVQEHSDADFVLWNGNKMCIRDRL